MGFSWKLDTAALIALLGVIISLLGLIWQVKKQRLQNSANMITSLVDRYESGSMRILRGQFARALLDEWNPSDEELEKIGATNFSRSLGLGDLPVMGFFENLALLTRKGVLDREMVWCKFGSRIDRWYQATEKLIKRVRIDLKHPTAWDEFEWLYKQTRKSHWALQRFNQPMFLRGIVFTLSQIVPIVGEGFGKLSEDLINDFLRQESKLSEG